MDTIHSATMPGRDKFVDDRQNICRAAVIVGLFNGWPEGPGDFSPGLSASDALGMKYYINCGLKGC